MKPIERNYRSVSFKNFLSGSILELFLYRPTLVNCAPTGHKHTTHTDHSYKMYMEPGQHAKQRHFLISQGYIYIYTLQSFHIPLNKLGKLYKFMVHSCQQKSIGLKFSKSQTGSDVRYSCHHNSSRFTFPIFMHSCHFSVLHSLQSVTPRIY